MSDLSKGRTSKESEDSEPDPDRIVTQRSNAADETARQPFVRPAEFEHQIWNKREVLEFFADLDSPDGMASDRRTIVALACIKADLTHFGFGK